MNEAMDTEYDMTYPQATMRAGVREAYIIQSMTIHGICVNEFQIN